MDFIEYHRIYQRSHAVQLRLYVIIHTIIELSLLQLIDWLVYCCCRCCELIQQTHVHRLLNWMRIWYPLSCDILSLPYHPSSTIVWSHHYTVTSCSHPRDPSCRTLSQLPIVCITSVHVVYSVSYCSSCSHASQEYIYTCCNHVSVYPFPITIQKQCRKCCIDILTIQYFADHS